MTFNDFEKLTTVVSVRVLKNISRGNKQSKVMNTQFLEFSHMYNDMM